MWKYFFYQDVWKIGKIVFYDKKRGIIIFRCRVFLYLVKKVECRIIDHLKKK